MTAEPRKPGTDGFRQFLRWLDQGADSEGLNYLELRRRLVIYFDRKNCRAPDELADETLNRAARRLEEEGTITDASPAHYCYILARYVFLEYQRRGEHRYVSLDALPESGAASSALAAPAPVTEPRQELLLGCLERCSRKLDPDHRDLIFEYYQGEKREKIEHRRTLAARLGLTPNALSIRACRIRDKLEACVRRCSGEGRHDFTDSVSSG